MTVIVVNDVGYHTKTLTSTLTDGLGPRGPLADMPGQAWCAWLGEFFHVRVGPDYDRHGKKAASDGSIYSPIGIDIYKSSSPIYHYGRTMKLPQLP